MSLATTIQRIAAQQGGKYGVPIVITQKVPGAGFPDPMTGAITAATQTANGKAIVSSASGSSLKAFDVQLDEGTLIETNLRSCLVFAYKLAFAPLPGDVVTGIEGSTWTVMGVTPESLQGVVISYKMTVKR